MFDRMLVIPERFFETRRDRMSGFRAVGLAFVVTSLTTGLMSVFLRLLANEMTGTTEIDNPNRPSEVTCDTFGETEIGAPSGCDEPETVTVEIGELFWEQAVEQLPALFVGGLLLWLLIGGGLHLFGSGLIGDGSFGQTLEVVAWSMLLNVLAVAVSVSLLLLAAQQVGLAVSDPEMLSSHVRRLTATTPGIGVQIVQVVALVAQVGVWTAGLAVVHRVDRKATAIGSVTVGAALFVLAFVW